MRSETMLRAEIHFVYYDTLHIDTLYWWGKDGKGVGPWAQKFEKHVQVKQGDNPSIQYLPEAGIPMLKNKQACPSTIHIGSM